MDEEDAKVRRSLFTLCSSVGFVEVAKAYCDALDTKKANLLHNKIQLTKELWCGNC